MLHDLRLAQRYVYDLSDVVETLRAVGEFDEDDPKVEAWVVNHLREYHRLDVEELIPYTRQPHLRDVDTRCGRFTETLTRTLYQLFFPMALKAHRAAFTDLAFRHHVLTVALYD